MLDIGWSELLVIAVVLIVVVGPKDLPPMLRAFGRMSRKLSGMAGEFRKQFDDALNESDMGDLRQTISDVQKLNPVHSLRDAMNPLRQAAEDIRTDIRKTVETPSAQAAAPVAVTLPDPAIALPDTVPTIPTPEPRALTPDAATVVTSTAALAEALPLKPVDEVIQVAPAAKVRAPRKPKTVSVIGDTVVSQPEKPARRSKAAVADEASAQAMAARTRRKTPAIKKDEA